MKKGIFAFCLFFCVQTIISQQENNLKLDSIKGLLEYKKAESAFQALKDNYHGNFKKDFNDVIDVGKKNMRKSYKKIYFNEEYESYLKQIVELIKSNNTDIQQIEIRPYFFYDETPNASMTIDGTMFVHLGLFDVVENESQLAMVLAHEISHYSGKHSYFGLIKNLEEFNSEENKRKRIEANRDGIDRIDRIDRLFKTEEMGFKKHSRNNEREADSMALVYLTNTPYALDEAILGIKILKKVDTDFFLMNTILKETFSFENAMFNLDWIKKPTSIGDKLKYKLSEKQRDSIRTHPKTEERYEMLNNAIDKNNLKDIIEISPEKFNKIKQDFKREILEFLIYDKQYSLAMYYVFKYQSEGDTSPYFKHKLVEILDFMKKALDNHALGKYVDNRNPFYPPQYNDLLIFIDNLNVEDFENLLTNYKQKNNI